MILCALLGLSLAGKAPGSEISPYGINIHAPEGADATAVLAQVKACGIGWVRIDFPWSEIEPSRGVHDWSLWDDLVGQARAAGLEIFASIGSTPAWATDGPPGIGVPASSADWAAFCSAAASRYRGAIRTWGIWNEPNLGGSWAGSRQQYIDVLLRPGVAAIRAASPEAQVLGPELAHLTSARWYRWLLDILQQAPDAIDIVAHHVYDRDGSLQVTKALNGSTVFGQNPNLWDLVSPSVREVLEAAHQVGKPFWLTETGWSTDQSSEDFQAAQYTGLLGDWLSGPGPTDWVGKIFFYELIDDGRPVIPPWGILRPDFSRKPAFDAYRAFIAAYVPFGDDADVEAVELPLSLRIGETGRARIVVRNTGSVAWSRAGGHQLSPSAATDLLAHGNQLLEPTANVLPGQTATFSFGVTGPQRPAAYPVSWRMTRVSGKPFGATALGTVTVTGVCSAPPAPAIRSAPPAQIPAGSVATVAWDDIWGGDSRLGVYRAQLATSAGFEASSLVADVRSARALLTVPTADAETIYRFRVQAISGCGVEGTFSPPVAFSAVKGLQLLVVTQRPQPIVARRLEAPATASLRFRSVGDVAVPVQISASGGFFTVAPAGATLLPGEELEVTATPRADATGATGVSLGRVVASWSGGTVSAGVTLAVTDTRSTGVRPVPAVPELLLLVAEGTDVHQATLAVRNPGPAPLSLVPSISPGGAWLTLDTRDFVSPLAPGETRTLQLTVDRRRRETGETSAPVQTVLTLAAASASLTDRAEVTVIDAEPPIVRAAFGRGPVPAGASSFVIPTAAHKGGVGGQLFVSSAVLRNLSPTPATVDIYMTGSGEDVQLSARAVTQTVPGLGTLSFPDLVQILFGATDLAGPVEIRSDSAAQLSLRTLVRGSEPSGPRFSAEIPVFSSGDGTGAGRPPLVVSGVKSTAAFRINLILAETTGQSATVGLRLFDSAGKELAFTEVPVPPWGNTQFPLMDQLGLAQRMLEAGSLLVEPGTGAGRVVAMATVVDNASASFSVLTGRPVPGLAAAGGVSQAIPSIVHASGVNALFTTELSITNGTQDPAPLALSYTYSGTDESGMPVAGTVPLFLTLAPRSSLPIESGRDAVVNLFRRPASSNTSGGLRVEGAAVGQIVARATISTPVDLSDKTRGTMSSEFASDLSVSLRVVGQGAASTAVCAGIRKWAGERVNLILTEMTGQVARARLRAGTTGGGTLAAKEYLLSANQKLQVNDIFGGDGGLGLGEAPLEGILFTLEATGTESGRAFGALTVIDNETSSSRILFFGPPGPPPRS